MKVAFDEVVDVNEAISSTLHLTITKNSSDYQHFGVGHPRLDPGTMEMFINHPLESVEKQFPWSEDSALGSTCGKADQLVHASINVTKGVYVHLLPGSRAKAAKVTEELL
jgi:hypothetical protein